MTPLAQAVIDLLRRKKGEAAPASAEPARVRTPTPGMLGSGAAQKAAVELLRRKSAPMDYVDSAQ